MRRFGEVLLQIYLLISLCSAAFGITEVLAQILGWSQSWFSTILGIFALVWFLATLFFVWLFRMYRIPHEYYILPIFYLASYVLLSGLSLLFSVLGIRWAWLSIFFITTSFLASGFELILAGSFLGKLSSFKKRVKVGKKRLTL